jgi:hypothetical protein
MKTSRQRKCNHTTSFQAEAVDASFGVAMTEQLEGCATQDAMTGGMLPWVVSARALLAHVFEVVRAAYSKKTSRRLCVAETVSLGEKRFVALLRIDGRELLIGGGAAGVSLLAAMGRPAEAGMAPEYKPAESSR